MTPKTDNHMPLWRENGKIFLMLLVFATGIGKLASTPLKDANSTISTFGNDIAAGKELYFKRILPLRSSNDLA